jgi:hypothetical protein
LHRSPRGIGPAKHTQIAQPPSRRYLTYFEEHSNLSSSRASAVFISESLERLRALELHEQRRRRQRRRQRRPHFTLPDAVMTTRLLGQYTQYMKSKEWILSTSHQIWLAARSRPFPRDQYFWRWLYCLHPSNVRTYLREKHSRLPRPERAPILEGLQVWPAIARSLEDITILESIDEPIQSLHLLQDRKQCRLEPDRSTFVCRSMGSLSKHWQVVHS